MTEGWNFVAHTGASPDLDMLCKVLLDVLERRREIVVPSNASDARINLAMCRVRREGCAALSLKHSGKREVKPAEH